MFVVEREKKEAGMGAAHGEKTQSVEDRRSNMTRGARGESRGGERGLGVIEGEGE